MKLKKKKISSRPSFLEEKKLWKNGYKYIIGIDEVGRGAFAGPVVVGAVIFSENVNICDEINDSKLLSPQKREKIDKEIRAFAQFYSIAEVGVPVINRVGIGKATSIAFRKVIASIVNSCCHAEFDTSKKLVRLLDSSASRSSKKEIPKPVQQVQGHERIEGQVRDDSKKKYFVLADGFHVKYIRGIGLKRQKAIIKGDQKSISIAAASIIAKVYRDKLMVNLSKKYSDYSFFQNKGYGTKAHQLAIKKHGLSKIHRESFKLKKFC